MWDAIASAGGAILGSVANAAGQLFVNKKNERFTRHMAGTQYQRSVNDMRAAGLNPAVMFGAGGGSPAAAPTGNMQNPLDFGSTAKTASDLMLARQAYRKMEAETELAEANAAAAKATSKNTVTEQGMIGEFMEQFSLPAQLSVIGQKYFGNWGRGIGGTAAAALAAGQAIHKVWGGLSSAAPSSPQYDYAAEHGIDPRDVPDPNWQANDHWLKRFFFRTGTTDAIAREKLQRELDDILADRERTPYNVTTGDGASARQRKKAREEVEDMFRSKLFPRVKEHEWDPPDALKWRGKRRHNTPFE